MKNILFILYFIIYSCTPAFGAATTTITADSIRSSNRTKTWTPPSITDVLTGLTDVQTLTNKTLTSPTINTPLIDVDTFTEQGSTPSTPAAGKRKVYAKADGIYHLDSAGNERKVGSGSGGGDVSYITNGNADDANASIFVPYADAAATRPVDGTGGSPTVTTSITSTAPLVGTKSYLLTKPASNVQGQGWAIPFTVDLGYRAKASKITVQYIVNSGTFVAGSDSTESDVIWYLYDVTNSALIEPSNIKMRASNTALSDQYEAEFQTSATGSSYRLIAHVQSTSALAYELKVDEIKVSPNRPIYSASVTEMGNPYVFSSNITTNATLTYKSRRVGDNIHAVLGWLFSGANTQASPGITLPIAVDTSKIASNGRLSVGQWYLRNSSTGAVFSGSVIVGVTGLGPTTASLEGFNPSLNLPTTIAANFELSAEINYPASGFSSSQRISDGYDGRDVSFNSTTASLTGVNPNNSTVKLAITQSGVDTVSGWESANNGYRIKASGTYDFSAVAQVNITNVLATYYQLIIFKNGSAIWEGNYQFATANTYIQLVVNGLAIPAVAGDIFDLRFFGGGNNSASTLTLNNVRFSGSKRQSPQTISANETIIAKYTLAVSSVIATNTVINFATKVFDTHNAVTTGASWKFTAPVAGFYSVTTLQNGNAAHNYRVWKNGTADDYVSGSPSVNFLIGGRTVLYLNAGDYIDVRPDAGATTQSQTYVIIKREL